MLIFSATFHIRDVTCNCGNSLKRKKIQSKTADFFAKQNAEKLTQLLNFTQTEFQLL
jgi:hypothetical protein